MKGRRAARPLGGREGEGGHHAPDRGPGARTPRPALAAAAAAAAAAAREKLPPQVPPRASPRRLPAGPGSGLQPRGAGSSGTGATRGAGARAWALSSSRAARAGTPQPGKGPGRRVPTPTPRAARPDSTRWPLVTTARLLRERGSRCCAPGPAAPGKPSVLGPALGLSGFPRVRGRAHAVHSCLFWKI